MSSKKLISSIIEIVLGVVLLVCGNLHVIDAFWSGMGTALVFVGVLYLIRSIRYTKDEKYKEAYDTAAKDERNRFLAMKAWSWTGYLLVLLFGVATIVFKIAGYEELMFFCSYTVCLILVIYWVSYFILRKKY
ncbi:MAG: hypothetical protein IKU57_01025 [Oscillospiraceae bacterium]|nr:hypothetical protein [Oscillospiraceae bacterium]